MLLTVNGGCLFLLMIHFTASMIAKIRITTEEEAKAALAERRRLAREQAEREAELERQRQVLSINQFNIGPTWLLSVILRVTISIGGRSTFRS